MLKQALSEFSAIFSINKPSSLISSQTRKKKKMYIFNTFQSLHVK